jgi:hypothetical protein
MIWGDGQLSIGDRVIYVAKGLQVGLFPDLSYDFGDDPSLDTF